MMFFGGILILVGLYHLDDAAVRGQRMGWGMVAVGLVLVVLDVWRDVRTKVTITKGPEQ